MADVVQVERRDRRGLDTFDDVLARWIDAEAHGDAAALDAVLDAEFYGDDPQSGVLTKQEWLERRRTGGAPYRSFAWEKVRTVVHDGTGVAMGVQVLSTGDGRRPRRRRFRATLVAVRRDDRWRVVNLQLSGILDGVEPT